jgi:class 3 adenylate cyclase
MRASRTNGGLDRPPLIDSVMGEPVTKGSAFGVPAGTVTFLLTDVEGSTRLWEQAPTAMPAVIARHY